MGPIKTGLLIYMSIHKYTSVNIPACMLFVTARVTTGNSAYCVTTSLRAKRCEPACLSVIFSVIGLQQKYETLLSLKGEYCNPLLQILLTFVSTLVVQLTA